MPGPQLAVLRQVRIDVDQPSGQWSESERSRLILTQRQTDVLEQLALDGSYSDIVGDLFVTVAGAPWGAAAYGGADPGRLPPELRVASAVQACVWLLAGLTALSRGGVAASPIPDTLSRRAVWTFAGLLAVGTVVDAASSSRWERFGWAPFLLVLTVLTFELARSGRPRAR